MRSVLIVTLCAMLTLCAFGCSARPDPDSIEVTDVVTVTDQAMDLSGTAIIGKVTAIDGNTITLQVGELTPNIVVQTPAADTPSPEPSATPIATKKPSSSAKPSGGSDKRPSGTPPAGGTGEKPSGTPPAGGSGEKPSGGGNPSGGSDSKPSGSAAKPSSSPTPTPAPEPSPMPEPSPLPAFLFTPSGGQVAIVVSGSTSIAIEGIGGDTQGTLADITVGAVIEVTYGEDDQAASIVVRNPAGDSADADLATPEPSPESRQDA